MKLNDIVMTKVPPRPAVEHRQKVTFFYMVEEKKLKRLIGLFVHLSNRTLHFGCCRCPVKRKRDNDCGKWKVFANYEDNIADCKKRIMSWLLEEGDSK